MTIESSVNDGITYSGNDSTTVFSFPFKVNLASQVEVIIRDALEAETTKVVDVDYTVTNQNVEGSGSLTYPISGDPLATGSKITITPVMDYKQSTDIRNQGRFAPTSHEQAFDTGMMHIKELKGLVDRAIKFKKSSNITGAEFDQDPEDNKILTWDGANGKIKNTSVSSLDVALISSFWEAVMGNADLSDSIAALGGATAFRAAIGIAPVTDFVKTILDDETAIEVRTTLGVTPATTANAGVSLLHKQVTCSNGTDTAHDMDFTAGNFQFDDGTGQAILGALTKRFDATFALGTGNGGMRSGESLPTDGTVYIYMISNAGGSITDIIGTTTADGSTISGDSVVIANSMTKKRRLACFTTDGSSNIRNGQYKFGAGFYKFTYNVGILDINDSNPGTSAVLKTMTCPPNSTIFISIFLFDDSEGAATPIVLFTSTNQTDTTPNDNNFTIKLTNIAGIGANNGESGFYIGDVDSSSQIRYRCTVSAADINLKGYLTSWTQYL